MHFQPRAAILGVTGLIGRGLPALLAQQAMVCSGVSRSAAATVAGIDGWQSPDQLDFTGYHAVINLAGESIACRWTARKRLLLHDSRVGLTRRVVAAIARVAPEQRPKVLVNASAAGIYGDRGDEVLTESSAAGGGYLADLCAEWEAAALEAEALGVRVVCLRTGIVLGRDAEAFRKLLRIFKWGVAGRLGSGRQWMPWIHLDDLRRAIVHALLSESMAGAVNCTAPAADRNRDFTRKLAAVLHRPAVLPVPGFVLKLVLDGFGAALLGSQHIRPAVLEGERFHFRWPTLESALTDLVC